MVVLTLASQPTTVTRAKALLRASMFPRPVFMFFG